MTSAPASTAWTMPAATPEDVPEPYSSEHPHRDDRGVAEPLDAVRVARDGSDLPGHVRAVAVRVHASQAAGVDVVGVPREVGAQGAVDLSGEVAVARVDAGVDDRDAQAGPVRGARRQVGVAEGVQRPLHAAVRVGRGVHRSVHRDAQHTGLVAQLGHDLAHLVGLGLPRDDLGSVVGDDDGGDGLGLLGRGGGGRGRGLLGLRRRTDAGHDHGRHQHRHGGAQGGARDTWRRHGSVNGVPAVRPEVVSPRGGRSFGHAR